MEQPRKWTSNQASIVERMIHTDAYQLLVERIGWLENRAITRLTSDNCDIDEVQRLRGKIAALRGVCWSYPSRFASGGIQWATAASTGLKVHSG